MKVIIKRPYEEYGHVGHISNTLENLQKTVEGSIEAVTFGPFTMIVNREGKMNGLPHNFYIRSGPYLLDEIVGTCIICGADGDDFCDVPISFPLWKKMLKEWGN